MKSRGNNGCFEHGMLGPIKSEKILFTMFMDDFGFQMHSFVTRIRFDNSKFVCPAAIIEDESFDLRCGMTRRFIRFTDGRLRQQQHIVGDV